MTPRATRPALASPCAAGLSDACLASAPPRRIVVLRMDPGYPALRCQCTRVASAHGMNAAFGRLVSGHLRMLAAVITNWRTGAGAHGPLEGRRARRATPAKPADGAGPARTAP